jgi:hypothetical protein
LILSVCALALSLLTPRILLFFPIMGAVGCAVIALFRRERAPFGAAVVIALAVAVIVLNEADLAAPTYSNLAAAEIVDWNWQKDLSFGDRGTIKWNVRVRNKSTHNISSVKVDFTTYDAQGRLVSSTFTYVEAIPPGQTRSSNSFADLYRTEEKATVQIAEVRFAQ